MIIIKRFITIFVLSYFTISLPNIFGLGYEIDWVRDASIFQKFKGYLFVGLTYGFLIKLIISFVSGVVGSLTLMLKRKDS